MAGTVMTDAAARIRIDQDLQDRCLEDPGLELGSRTVWPGSWARGRGEGIAGHEALLFKRGASGVAPSTTPTTRTAP